MFFYSLIWFSFTGTKVHSACMFVLSWSVNRWSCGLSYSWFCCVKPSVVQSDNQDMWSSSSSSTMFLCSTKTFSSRFDRCYLIKHRQKRQNGESYLRPNTVNDIWTGENYLHHAAPAASSLCEELNHQPGLSEAVRMKFIPKAFIAVMF